MRTDLLAGIVALVTLGLPPALRGADGLEFDRQEIAIALAPADEHAKATFTFINQGTAPLVIMAVETACSCTQVEWDRKSFAPGEHGSIQAVFTAGQRRGTQTGRFIVRTDRPELPSQTLTLTAVIPPMPLLSSEILTWNAQDGRRDKTVTVIVPTDSAYRIIGVESRSKTFAAVLKPTAQSNAWEVIVTPLQAQVAEVAAIEVITNYRRLRFFAEVASGP